MRNVEKKYYFEDLRNYKMIDNDKSIQKKIFQMKISRRRNQLIEEKVISNIQYSNEHINCNEIEVANQVFTLK